MAKTLVVDETERGPLGMHWLTCAALAVLFLFPLVWAAFASVRTDTGFGLENYARLFSSEDGVRPRHVLNSAVVSALTVGGTLVVSTLGGYAFGRFRFPGRDALFLLTLAILMVPYATILIALYVLLGWLGLEDSLLGLSLVLTTFQLPFSVFMMRNSFAAVPVELEESARVDGCTSFGALLRIMLPAVRPGLVTVGLFAFLASWSEFFAPLILLNSTDKFTTTLAVVNLRTASHGAVDYAALEAGVVVMAVPCLLLFAFLQRSYVRGFTSGALKG
ncbi:carbohydrate ABC transporter permease [Actinosynnema mirum]|uniref:Binding-protein-dependent transport systems inner membrane component n=2 Tax=Actinosynnema TaxID=40566 RepID=C6WQA9_ACTMD|nr:carbohydrate ABC transporter permease [Actinosynnema mirum]ACU36763.1 binding-protein-dependent transport systems inner membrane component [Actinosynnema mirum DSM 43827]AXX30223.1 ABC-type sugar transport system, permease component [Actinosynnema pretiosum subsp. pretiosum]